MAGRPQNIETLPAEAEPAILKALDNLRERRASIYLVWKALNTDLAEIGLKPVSKSAFYRFSRRADAGDVPPRFRPQGNGRSSALPAALEQEIIKLIDARIQAAPRRGEPDV